uniref:3-isopropylmalate dehydratase small subunit n=1 Tax=Anunuuluaehu liula TaxID=3049639 RepID=UPI003001916A
MLKNHKVSIDTVDRGNNTMSIILTTNRNFSGRMAAKSAKIYLGLPFPVASTAITGHINNHKVFLNY